MSSLRNYFILIFCTVTLCWSCRHDPDVPGFPEISFKHDVQSIITGNCTQSGCHTGTGGEQFGLVTYENISDLTNPGNARDSRLYKAITGKSANIMPPPSQPMLTEEQIRLIYVWIEQGAKNN